jgi:hypothetical protein
MHPVVRAIGVLLLGFGAFLLILTILGTAASVAV